jgi:hypothetical protein
MVQFSLSEITRLWPLNWKMEFFGPPRRYTAEILPGLVVVLRQVERSDGDVVVGELLVTGIGREFDYFQTPLERWPKGLEGLRKNWIVNARAAVTAIRARADRLEQVLEDYEV